MLEISLAAEMTYQPGVYITPLISISRRNVKLSNMCWARLQTSKLWSDTVLVAVACWHQSNINSVESLRTPLTVDVQVCAPASPLSPLLMDLYTLIPRTLVGVVYPAFASLKAVLSGSADQSAAWLRYWVVLGVFSVLELLADPLLNPLSYSFPLYLVLKCSFLVWCMIPAKWNGSDLLFNQVRSWQSQRPIKPRNSGKVFYLSKLNLCRLKNWKSKLKYSTAKI